MPLRPTCLALAILAALSLPPARAGQVDGYTFATPIASSFCSMTLASSLSLSSCGSGIPTGATCVFYTVTGANLNWRDDTTAATATVGSGGQQVAQNSSQWYCGVIANLRFIQQSATATISASFYK